ncbi:MAG: type II secretion system F family protein [Desulfuromonadales bacterium]|nr:type II secretion system F family protein [Desulfuromonadales bacterium]
MADILNFINRTFGSGEMLLIQLAVFFSVVLFVGVLLLIFLRRNPASQRLGRLLRQDAPAPLKKTKLLEEEDQGVVAKVATPLHGILSPSNAEGRQRARTRLLQGGFRSQKSYRNYFALKLVLTGLLPGLFLLRGMFYRFTPEVFLICLGLAVVGYFLPSIGLSVIIKKRQQAIFRALPDALDLMVICVESGLGLDMTFKRVGDELRSLSSDLSDEFHTVNREIRAGRPRSESLKNMSLRTGVAEVQNLMTMLVQTTRFGTSMARALRVHADAMRVKRRQVAEERAAKTAIKLTLPLILFIFPATMVVLLGPAGLKIMKVLLPVLGKTG